MLLTDKLLSNIRSKIFNTLIRNVEFTSNVFTWYTNYNSIADNKGGVDIF